MQGPTCDVMTTHCYEASTGPNPHRLPTSRIVHCSVPSDHHSITQTTEEETSQTLLENAPSFYALIKIPDFNSKSNWSQIVLRLLSQILYNFSIYRVLERNMIEPNEVGFMNDASENIHKKDQKEVDYRYGNRCEVHWLQKEEQRERFEEKCHTQSR